MPWRAERWLLGGRFAFESDSRALLRLVDWAFAGLPPHRFETHAAPFRIRLRLINGALSRRSPAAAERSAASAQRGIRARVEPSAVRTLSGPGGLLCGIMNAHNFALLSPRDRTGLVVASADKLLHPYHVRYELLEFSVFMLAARAQALVPLHGGCIGRRGRGLLLIGDSGAGKSTLSLHSMLRGLQLLAEDAVFVRPEPLRATGIANFLHLRPDAVRFIDDPVIRRRLQRSPVIHRRSGVQKLEIDLRSWAGAICRSPVTMEGVIFLSAGSGRPRLVTALKPRQMAQRLRASQPYASTQPGWQALTRQLARVPAFEVRRARHPAETAEAIAALLG